MGNKEIIEEKTPTEWFIPGNPKNYNVDAAFKKLGKIDWKQSANIDEGDIVYIYLANPIAAVCFKCRANKVNMNETSGDGNEFYISEDYDDIYGRYMELEMLEKLSGSAFSRETLKNYGFTVPQGRPVRVIPTVKTYLDLIQKLQHSEELNPDKHDGSYELVRETIKLYADLGDLSVCDYKDLNLVYLMTIGTWRHSVDRKKKLVDNSHLPEDSKTILKTLLDVIWNKAVNNEYENGDGTLGMFGTGFYTFEGKTDDVSPRNFIQACVDSLKIDDSKDDKDEQIFDIVAKVLTKDFRGMKSASASMVLHCLKPFTFPILNNNNGSGDIFQYFNIPLERKTEVYTYIENCRKVKKFRDENFTIKNYRIFDMEAWNLKDDNLQTDEEANEPIDQIVEFDKNLILYGPPGTGKTYKTAMYAVAICDGKALEDLIDYDSVMKRYKQLQKEQRIAFTTFHQSYGYEEFIEGIKPVVSSDQQGATNSNISYKIESGIFKEFCETAIRAKVKNDKFEIPDDATIWKTTVRSVVREDCFKNNRIRIDWGINSEGAYSFVNDMKNGDIVLTTDGSRSIINGIGVITNDNAYSLDSENDATTRDIMWLATDINEDIKDLNTNKILHRMTVARVPNMKVTDVVALAKTHNPQLSSTEIVANEKPYVFIIDEINRGNISKIFGELITLIENTKRHGMSEATSAILPYSGEEFSVPQNVYIIATMNTADRSIALMDTALRRRFSFVEMMPETDVLRDIGADLVDVLNVADMLDVINERIAFLYDREHTIGHAFFTPLKDNPSIETLQGVFEKSIIPLLQEYFYEDYQKIQVILGDNGKEDPNLKFILDEKIVAKNIFKGNVEDVIDLPDKKYSINKKAFSNIQSYIEIM